MQISLTKLTTKTLATLADQVIFSSKSGNYKVVENHPLLNRIEEQYAQYDKVYTKKTFSGKGVEVKKADERRDKIFRSIKMFLKGHSGISSVAGYKEALILNEIFERLGSGMNNLSYADKSAKLKKIIESLTVSENFACLESLGLTIAFEELRMADDFFKKLYAEQAEANADLRSLPSASKIRKNLEAALRDYFNLLESMQTVPDWEGIYGDINELVKAADNGRTK